MKKKNFYVMPVLLIFGLLIRIVYVNILRFAFTTVPEELTILYQGLTFSSIIILIIYLKEDIKEYFLEKSSVFIILFLGPFLHLPVSSKILTNILMVLLIWIPAIYLVLKMIGDRNFFSYLPTGNTKLFFIGILWGVLIYGISVIASMWLYWIVINKPIQILVKPSLNVIVGFIREYGHASALEEPLFRGFLMGYLIKQGYKPARVIIFQSILFWIAHLYDYRNIYNFWISLPIFTISVGLIAYKNKSILPGMSAHAVINSMGYLLSQNKP